MKPFGRLFVFFLVILIADQVTKALALRSLAHGVNKVIVPGLFNLTLVMNRGAAFGMFGGLPDGTRKLALGAVSIIALVMVLRLLVLEAKGDKVAQFALVGVLSGAIGNIIDRFRFDGVVDFLDFYWQTHHWPAFNVADSAICVCVGLLVIRMLIGDRSERNESSGERRGDVPQNAASNG